MVKMKYYLIKESPEIPLKSWRTRPKFEKALLRAIEQALKNSEAKYTLKYSQGVFFLEVDRDVSRPLTRVFGVHDVCEVVPYRFNSIEDIASRAEDFFKDTVANKKFAVRVKRYGNHSFTSMDVARAVGSKLLKYSSGVNLKSPDVEVKIEIREEFAYYVLSCWKGMGGLPVGTEGRALVMFSGGFDSSLAYVLSSKRGIQADFLHYYMGSAEATASAIEVAKKLAELSLPYEPSLTVVNFVPILSEIREKVSSRLRQVVLRVVMHEVGQALAERYGYDALITGESIGQTSSQTLKNIKVVDYFVRPRVALLRPLSGADKEEIVNRVRELGLYDYVVKVEEVCRLSEGPVETKARIEDVEAALALLSKDTIEGVVQNAKTYRVVDAVPSTILREIGADIEVDEVPEGWILVDIRSKERFDYEHIPGAIHVSELREVPDSPVVLYCDYGSASLLSAIEMRKAGVKAYSLRGGFIGYRKRSRKIECEKA